MSTKLLQQLIAPGVTGHGRAVPNHVVVATRMEQGRSLNLLSMEVANAKDQPLLHKTATPKSAQWIALGMSGHGEVAPPHVEMQHRMALGPFLNLQNMEASTALGHSLTPGVATLLHACRTASSSPKLVANFSIMTTPG